jgi:hypothetical protein
MNATCDVSSARVDLGKGDPLQYIYNQGYLFKTGGISWTPLSYTSSESLIANAWYPKTATTNIPLTQTDLQNPNYNLAYICSWTGTAWKCRCRDSACTQSYCCALRSLSEGGADSKLYMVIRMESRRLRTPFDAIPGDLRVGQRHIRNQVVHGHRPGDVPVRDVQLLEQLEQLFFQQRHLRVSAGDSETGIATRRP